MNSPQSRFNETDLTVTPGIVISGISGVIAKTKRGPIGAADLVITSWEQFKQVYGGFSGADTDPTPLMLKRALEQGSALRVSRAVHYDDITSPGGYEATFSIQIANSHFALASALVAGQTIVYHQGADSVSQDFDTSAAKTMALLAAQILVSFSNVLDVIVLDTTHFYVVPNAGAVITDSVTTSGTSAPAVIRTTNNAFMDADGNTLFSLSAKYPGLDYDKIVASILPASNGNSNYFNLRLDFLGGELPTENYPNLLIPGAPANPTFLDEVAKRSKMVQVAYTDLSGIVSTPIIPVPYKVKFGGGDDGGAIVAADLIGDSAGKTGLYAFDGVDDIPQLAVVGDPDSVFTDASVAIAGAAYAENRKDLQFFAFLPGLTEQELIDAKDDMLIDTSYIMFFGGYIKVIHPITSVQVSIPAIGDILALAAYSDANFGLWFSFSGRNRGAIQNSLGADNKWGSEGNIVNLNLLANHQINVVINRKGKTVLWGSFTGQLATSQLSLTNIRRLHMYIKKTLGPTMEDFLEEPNDFTTWLNIYLSIKPTMDGLRDKRAIFDYRWEGDQFATNLSQLKVNNPDDVALGTYKVRLFVKDIASMQEFTVDIVLTPLGISFEDALSIVQP